MGDVAEPWAIGPPIVIRFDGLEADNHEIDMAALAESLKGLARIIGVAGNFAVNQKYVQHKDALSVKVVVKPPEAHCFEILAWLKWASGATLTVSIVAGLAVTLVGYVFKKAAGDQEEMRQLRGALDEAIKQLGTRDQSVVDRLLSTVDRMADALRPAVKQAVAPIGTSARTLSISENGSAKVIKIGIAERDAIMAEEPTDIGEEHAYTILITELDMETGACRWSSPSEPETRTLGRITDPALTVPNNLYALHLAAKTPLRVRAKAASREGEITQLYISNIAPLPPEGRP